MKNLRAIAGLTTLAVFLTVALFAFTLANTDKLRGPEMPGCGTVFYGNDAIYLNEYEVPLDHPGLKVFQTNCKICHRLDQKLVGPALRNSFETRDSTWFVRMTLNAGAVIASGDTLAIRLFNEYNQTPHPDYKSFTTQELSDLVEYLKLEGLRDDGE